MGSVVGVDLIIQYRIFAILSEMGQKWPISLYFDFDPERCIKKYGFHHIYEFSILVRDDLDADKFIREFRSAMEKQNKISAIKSELYGVEEYPAHIKNYSTLYISVTNV